MSLIGHMETGDPGGWDSEQRVNGVESHATIEVNFRFPEPQNPTRLWKSKG